MVFTAGVRNDHELDRTKLEMFGHVLLTSTSYVQIYDFLWFFRKKYPQKLTKFASWREKQDLALGTIAVRWTSCWIRAEMHLPKRGVSSLTFVDLSKRKGLTPKFMFYMFDLKVDAFNM